MFRLVRRTATYAVGTALTSGLLVLTALSGYLALITVAGTRRGAVTRQKPTHKEYRFAILVPAHNEELTIDRALRSFRELEYPPDRFDVHVVADNCTDDTAGVVRRSGFNVHERFDPVAPGKGPALNWLFEQLQDSGCDADIIVIVDADTTLDPGFLLAMAQVFGRGTRAAQGYYSVRDAESNTAAALRFAALACRHHLRPLGRQRLGGTCGLYGNGMAFEAELLKGRQWSGHLTEDAEFQLDLLLDGERVTYVPAALLEAEMPQTLRDSTTQNERWELGRLQLARRYIPVLGRRTLNEPGPLRAAYMDAIWDQLLPPLSVMAAADVASIAGSTIHALLRPGRLSRMNLVLASSCCVVLAGHALSGLRSVGAPRATYTVLLRAPQMIVWKVTLWLRVLRRPSSVDWRRTKRNAESV